MTIECKQCHERYEPKAREWFWSCAAPCGKAHASGNGTRDLRFHNDEADIKGTFDDFGGEQRSERVRTV